MALKRDILLGALKCFNELGVDTTTIDQIKVRCDTSVGNIYHHFGNKDGLVIELLFCALNDQFRMCTEYFARARTVKDGVVALVHSYVDWATSEPELALFLAPARTILEKGPLADKLTARYEQRDSAVYAWLLAAEQNEGLETVPPELIASLVIGPADYYCRAWLSKRVTTPPFEFREPLARSTWASLQEAIVKPKK